MKLPEWAAREEIYNPGSDRDYFISRSLLRLVSILKALRQQHELAKAQQKSGGGIVSFVVKGGREQAWTVVDNCQLLSITANLGDVKTTITHPASTTHGRISPEARAAAGINEGLLRIAVGLEAVEDLQADLERGLSLI